MVSKRLLLLPILGSTLACGSARDETRSHMAERAPESSRALDSLAGAPAAVTGNGSTSPLPAVSDLAVSRKLIRNGALAIEVEDAASSAARVEAIATDNGGYLSGLQGGRDGSGRQSSTVSVRVPAESFTKTMQAIRLLGDVETDQVSTQDVGKEYTDLEARLRTKQAVAERMREILSTKTASLDELFQAERELASVLEQIEQLEGQRRFYDNQIALSTITATVHEHFAGTVAAAPPAPSRFFDPTRRSFASAREALAVVVGGVVWISVVAGPWALLVALGLLLAKRLRRGRLHA
jgi:hypothetical protein